jgi:hypothetical protein
MKPWAPVPRGRKAHADGVTVYPIERLGNQLFTYAAVFAQARRMSVPCYVNKGGAGRQRLPSPGVPRVCYDPRGPVVAQPRAAGSAGD